MVPLIIEKTKEKIFIELDRDKLEILMGSLGILSDETINSITRAEKDYSEGRFYVLKKSTDLLSNRKTAVMKK